VLRFGHQRAEAADKTRGVDELLGALFGAQAEVFLYSLKPRQTESADDAFGNGTAALLGHQAAALDQLRFGRSIDHIAFAKSLPVQTIGLVENHFVKLGFSCGALGRAENDTDSWF
jgi:hypothetical protein